MPYGLKASSCHPLTNLFLGIFAMAYMLPQSKALDNAKH